MFYAKLASMVDSCPRRDIRIVLGDFNAVSGCDRAGYEMSVSPHGSGVHTGSENSLLFRDFARSQKLRISGSWDQRPDALVRGSSRTAGCIGVLSSVALTLDWL